MENRYSEGAFNLQWKVNNKDQKLLRQCMRSFHCRYSVTGTKRRLKLLLSREIFKKKYIWGILQFCGCCWINHAHISDIPHLLSAVKIGLLINHTIYSFFLIQITLYLPASLIFEIQIRLHYSLLKNFYWFSISFKIQWKLIFWEFVSIYLSVLFWSNVQNCLTVTLGSNSKLPEQWAI